LVETCQPFELYLTMASLTSTSETTTEIENGIGQTPIPAVMWPFGKASCNIKPGIYQLSPSHPAEAPAFNIILYAKASHFMDLDESNHPQNEMTLITLCFRDTISGLYPDARILLVWNVTYGFTTKELMVVPSTVCRN
jgi:hypothetical protein